MSPTLTSQALRTIGRDLDFRGLKTFSIACDGDHFVVEAGYQSPPAATPVTIHYCRKDIEELDRKAAESSIDLSHTRSFIYLSEILTGIGVYVEDKGARLVKISNESSTEHVPTIDIEYETLLAGLAVERLADADIYALCIREHKRRQRNQASNQDRFSRFSSLTALDVTAAR